MFVVRRFQFAADNRQAGRFGEFDHRALECVIRRGPLHPGDPSEVERETLRLEEDGSSFVIHRYVEHRIRELLAEGYVEIYGERPGLAKEPAASEPRAKLEARLIAAPEDYASWQVYADMMSAAGDPRGELIAIGVALARGEGDADGLRRRETQLLQRHADEWFGRLVSDGDWRECFAFTLRTGHWDRVRLGVNLHHQDLDIPAALSHLLELDSARFLRQLELRLPQARIERAPGAWSRVLAEHGPLPSLRRLRVGMDYYHFNQRDPWPDIGELGGLWTALPALEALYLEGWNIELGGPPPASLRELHVVTFGLSRATAEQVASAELPELEHLELCFGISTERSECGPSQARALLDNPSLDGLRHLALTWNRFGDALAELLTRTPLPAKLRTLDLSYTCMSDAGAAKLLVGVDALAKFEVLNLRGNFLSMDMCTRLRAALPNTCTERQMERYELNEFLDFGVAGFESEVP